MYHEIQVMFYSIKAHVIYPIMNTCDLSTSKSIWRTPLTIHLSILKMSAKPIR